MNKLSRGPLGDTHAALHLPVLLFLEKISKDFAFFSIFVTIATRVMFGIAFF